MNKVVVVAQWGDEGKAKITDLLAQDADLIIRYQGRCNAGHTVVAHNKTFKFHLIPSGILYKGKNHHRVGGFLRYFKTSAASVHSHRSVYGFQRKDRPSDRTNVGTRKYLYGIFRRHI